MPSQVGARPRAVRQIAAETAEMGTVPMKKQTIWSGDSKQRSSQSSRRGPHAGSDEPTA